MWYGLFFFGVSRDCVIVLVWLVCVLFLVEDLKKCRGFERLFGIVDEGVLVF